MLGLLGRSPLHPVMMIVQMYQTFTLFITENEISCSGIKRCKVQSLKALLDGSTFTKNLAKSINYLHVSIMKRVASPPRNWVSPIFSVALSTFHVSNRIGNVKCWERSFFCRLEVWDGFLLNMQGATFRGASFLFKCNSMKQLTFSLLENVLYTAPVFYSTFLDRVFF